MTTAQEKPPYLEGIAVAIGGCFVGFDSVPARHILPHEIRYKNFMMGTTPTLEPQYPAKVSCKAVSNHKEISWSRSVNSAKGRTNRNDAKKIIKWASELQKRVRSGSKDLLPVFAYYGTGRLWAANKQKTDDPFQPGSRFVGYTDCLDQLRKGKKKGIDKIGNINTSFCSSNTLDLKCSSFGDWGDTKPFGQNDTDYPLTQQIKESIAKLRENIPFIFPIYGKV